MDLLVMEDFILRKEEQPSMISEDAWGSQYDHD